MSEQFRLTRRSMLAGAAVAGALAPVVTSVAHAEGGDIKTNPAATAANIATLKRVKVDLVRPPFVHAHTQKGEGAPKVIAVSYTHLTLPTTERV